MIFLRRLDEVRWCCYWKKGTRAADADADADVVDLAALDLFEVTAEAKKEQTTRQTIDTTSASTASLLRL